MSQVYYVSTTNIVERRRRIRKASWCYAILERSGKYWVGHGLLFMMFLGTFKQKQAGQSNRYSNQKRGRKKSIVDST